MKRNDDFETRRAHLAGMSDDELKAYFWELAGRLTEPLLKMGREYTSPSIERSVLLRMGFSSLEVKPIVDRAYEEIVESGLELYDEGVFETRYDGEVDMASKQISFWEGENARISFLVAQPLRREGYYRYMEVTYIPEEMDDVYGEMIAELREACDLELPELPKF